tara:strand:+ start:601 stop:804 length:204 start_codon:yes stop_codon:yes gene_type:complete
MSCFIYENVRILWYIIERKEMDEYNYSVWVGGTEVNDYYLNYSESIKLSEHYKGKGYDDVRIEKIKR